MASTSRASLPILDLSLADDPQQKPQLLARLHDALFNVGFLYITNHGVAPEAISNLVALLPALFDQPAEARAAISKMNSPHFLGYSGYAEGVTLGLKDLREQFDFATELPVIWDPTCKAPQTASRSIGSQVDRDLSQLYWRLRGPNQCPSEDLVPGFRSAYTEYHDAVQELSYRFLHLVEEAFGIPVGTFDAFFQAQNSTNQHIPPQHRIKLVKYPPSRQSGGEAHGQGVGAHKDSSGWLTLLLQVGGEKRLEVLESNGEWIAAPPIDGTFVVNFGNALEAATDGAVRATVHRVKAPSSDAKPRYSIPFFQGLPYDLTVSQIQSYIPERVKQLRNAANGTNLGSTSPDRIVSTFLDPRWSSLGDSQLRKWIRSHEDVGRKFYGDEVAQFYLS